MGALIIILIICSSLGIFGGVGYAIWNYYQQRKLINQKISDQTVIEIARANNGKMNVALLCEHTGITAPEAKTKLKYLSENGVLATDWSKLLLGGGHYILPNTQDNNIFTKFFNTRGPLAKRLEVLFSGNETQENNSPKSLNQNKDAQIISLALENQGVVSASAVCVKLNITIDEAQKRLEDLRQKQIFISEVGQNGGLVYRLLDV